MDSKAMIWVGLLVGSTIGGLIGGVIDGGNFLGLWGILLGGIGGIIGSWAGYKIVND